MFERKNRINGIDKAVSAFAEFSSLNQKVLATFAEGSTVSFGDSEKNSNFGNIYRECVIYPYDNQGVQYFWWLVGKQNMNNVIMYRTFNPSNSGTPILKLESHMYIIGFRWFDERKKFDFEVGGKDLYQVMGNAYEEDEVSRRRTLKVDLMGTGLQVEGKRKNGTRQTILIRLKPVPQPVHI